MNTGHLRRGDDKYVTDLLVRERGVIGLQRIKKDDILSVKGGTKMQVVYDKLFALLKANHITQKEFLNCGISSSTLNKLRNNQNITTDIICRICDYFACMPDEIMEWIPDENFEAKRKERLEIQKQIADLQAKLNNRI